LDIYSDPENKHQTCRQAGIFALTVCSNAKSKTGFLLLQFTDSFSRRGGRGQAIIGMASRRFYHFSHPFSAVGLTINHQLKSECQKTPSNKCSMALNPAEHNHQPFKNQNRNKTLSTPPRIKEKPRRLIPMRKAQFLRLNTLRTVAKQRIKSKDHKKTLSAPLQPKESPSALSRMT
jgi:hypothetical protein